MAFNALKMVLARRRKGLTQAVLAEQVGVSRSSIVGYEHRFRTPRLNTLNRLEEALGLEPGDLLR